MKYTGAEQPGTSPGRIGVLLVNLGTPDAPSTGPLRRYLREFLADPRVVEAPRWLWWLVLNGIILRIRPRRSAAAYRKVWTERGSPLLFHTEDQCRAVAAHLARGNSEPPLVDFAMRYGNPNMDEVIAGMMDNGVERLLVLPLYPQYSAPSSASTFDRLAKNFLRRRRLPHLRFVADYHDHPLYIEALVNSVREHWQQHGRADRLLLSYHGTPQSYVDAGDPYQHQCLQTTQRVRASLGLSDGDCLTVFQSRFGRATWLQPYTDKTLETLPDEGVKSVQVMCPGFAADCLETLEEIALEARDTFIEAGGERFEYIPCLNTRRDHIEALTAVIEENLTGWAR